MKWHGSKLRAYEDLWRSLARRSWTAVALVPAEPSGSTLALATALAEAGKRLGSPAVAIAAPTDEEGAGALRETVREAAASARVVVSAPAVLDDPRSLAVVQAVDLVVVSIERGRTVHADAKRTIELVGRERVAGCFLVG